LTRSRQFELEESGRRQQEHAKEKEMMALLIQQGGEKLLVRQKAIEDLREQLR